MHLVLVRFVPCPQISFRIVCFQDYLLCAHCGSGDPAHFDASVADILYRISC